MSPLPSASKHMVRELSWATNWNVEAPNENENDEKATDVSTFGEASTMPISASVVMEIETVDPIIS